VVSELRLRIPELVGVGFTSVLFLMTMLRLFLLELLREEQGLINLVIL